MTKTFIARELGVYTKELGMGIASHASGDISRKTPFLFERKGKTFSNLKNCLDLVYFLDSFLVFLAFFCSILFRFEQQAEYSFPSITVLTDASIHWLSGSVGVQYGHLWLSVFAWSFIFSPQF